ncbi:MULTISPECIES: TIGR01777 family oxidoreductase [Anaerolinea]|uniref:TIGR01777 family oxidoreductase n=1 Tax=Anaerolinea TaxID=233189 RepID=UPI00263491CA|nr:TIGR01777 family oxidoreductase [Anaerolinea thermophila]
MPSVIVTGGSGLIGQSFCREMQSAGWEVVIVSRSPRRGASGGQFRQIGWEDLPLEMENARAVVNLAGENIGAGRWTKEKKQRIQESRLQAGKMVSQAFFQASRKPEVLIQSSAIGYYGTQSGDLALDEAAPGGEDFLAQVGRAWEQSTREVEDLGVRRVIIRTGVVLAREGGVLNRMVLPVRLGVGGPLGSGRQWISWIHIQDQVRAMRFLIETTSARGVYNLTAPTPVQNQDFMCTLAKVLRRPCWLPVPGFALRVLLGEMSTLVLDGQRVVPARLLAEGFVFAYPHLEEALRNLLE